MFGIATKWTTIKGAEVPVPRNPVKLPVDKAAIDPYLFPSSLLRAKKPVAPKVNNTVDIHDSGFTPLGSENYGSEKHFYTVPFSQ
jgi:hypothetical protein